MGLKALSLLKEITSSRSEKWLFALIVLLSASPVFVAKYFPTLDGAAHLYNSNIILELLLNEDSAFSTYFQLNSEPVPNWLGHFILSLFNLLFPAFLAEKVLVLLYLISFPYAFRQVVLDFNSNNKLLTYLGIPFIYSSVFLLGFYNFSLAVVLMLSIFSYWHCIESTSLSWKKFVSMFFLLTLTFFAHLFVFGITLLLLGLYTSFKATVQKSALLIFFRKALFLISTAFLPLILAIRYFLNTNSLAVPGYFSSEQLIDELFLLKSLMAYAREFEAPFVQMILFCFIALIVIAAFHFFRFKKQELKESPLLQHFWLFISIVILVLYFTLPNSTGSAGFISIRLNYLFFLFFALWIASLNSYKKLVYLPVGVVLFCSFYLSVHYTKTIFLLNRTAVDIEKATPYVSTSSSVLPVNFSNHWLMNHFSNYLGVDKSIVVLENYESIVDYFPVKMNREDFPNILFGKNDVTQSECIYWLSEISNPREKADYVFVLGSIESRNDACGIYVKDILASYYTPIYQNKSCQLFIKKTSN